MSKVIRAADRQSGLAAVAFNFDDLSTQAGKYLDEVRQQARTLLKQAAAEAESARGRVENEARQSAEKQFQARIDASVAQQLQTALPALQQAAEELRVAKDAWLAHWERQAVRLAAAIAARVVRRELARQPEIPLTLVREALQLASGAAEIRLRLHPEDRAALATSLATVVRELAPAGQAELIADERIERGGCRVETQFGVVDAQFAAQLARIEEELT